MTDRKAKGEGPGNPAPRVRKPESTTHVAEWLPKEFKAELEKRSLTAKRAPWLIDGLAAFGSNVDCRIVVEGLQKRGWSGAEISDLLTHAYWCHTWGSVRQARGWEGWTLEERTLRVKAFARACRKLQQEFTRLESVIEEASFALGRRTQVRMLLYSLRGIDANEPLIGDGIPRKNTLPDRMPLRSLADFVESLPREWTGKGRNDEHKARRRLVCSVAAQLQFGKCPSWANFTSLLVSAVTGDDLSDIRVRQVTKAHPDLFQEAMDSLVEAKRRQDLPPTKRRGLLSRLMDGEKDE